MILISCQFTSSPFPTARYSLGRFSNQRGFCLTLEISPDLERWLWLSHAVLPFFTESNKRNLYFLLTGANKQLHMREKEKPVGVVFRFSKSVHASCNPQLCSRALHSFSLVPFFHSTRAGRCCINLLSEQLPGLVGTGRWLLWNISKRGKKQELPNPLQVPCYGCIGKATCLKEPGEANEAKRRVRLK